MASDGHDIPRRRGRPGSRCRHTHEVDAAEGPASAGRLAYGRHVLEMVSQLQPAKIVGVVAPGTGTVAQAFAPHATVVRASRSAPVTPTRAALPALEGHRGPVLVVYADCPLLTGSTLAMLVEACRERQAAVGVLEFVARSGSLRPADRVQRRAGEDRRGTRCQREEKAIDFCNSGVMVVDGAAVRLAGRVGTTTPRASSTSPISSPSPGATAPAAIAVGPAGELLGINSRVELAAAEAALQHRLRRAAMEGGATLIDPASVFLAADTGWAARDDRPQCPLRPRGHRCRQVEIMGFCHIEGAAIERGATIGPFARLRPGTGSATAPGSATSSRPRRPGRRRRQGQPPDLSRRCRGRRRRQHRRRHHHLQL